MASPAEASEPPRKATFRWTSASMGVALIATISLLLVGGAVGFLLRHSPSDELVGSGSI
jgi:hypothetical protein